MGNVRTATGELVDEKDAPGSTGGNYQPSSINKGLGTDTPKALASDEPDAQDPKYGGLVGRSQWNKDHQAWAAKKTDNASTIAATQASFSAKQR